MLLHRYRCRLPLKNYKPPWDSSSEIHMHCQGHHWQQQNHICLVVQLTINNNSPATSVLVSKKNLLIKLIPLALTNNVMSLSSLYFSQLCSFINYCMRCKLHVKYGTDGTADKITKIRYKVNYQIYKYVPAFFTCPWPHLYKEIKCILYNHSTNYSRSLNTWKIL